MSAHSSPQCIASKPQFATSTLGASTAVTHAVEKVSLNNFSLHHYFGYSSDRKNDSSTSLGTVNTILYTLFTQGLSSLRGGFSLTNAFEVPLIIYNGKKRFGYSARPTLVDFVEMGISGEEIH